MRENQGTKIRKNTHFSTRSLDSSEREREKHKETSRRKKREGRRSREETETLISYLIFLFLGITRVIKKLKPLTITCAFFS